MTGFGTFLLVGKDYLTSGSGTTLCCNPSSVSNLHIWVEHETPLPQVLVAQEKLTLRWVPEDCKQAAVCH